MSIEEEAPTNTDSIVVSVQEGDLNLVNDFLENGGEANTCDSDGIPLLHWAAINNRLEIAKSLLLKNADVNATTGALLSTPLHWAAREGNLEIIKLLIEHGADILKSDGEGNSALHTAAALGHSSIVAYLIAKGVDSNLPNSNNKTTPLMVAVVDKKNTETCLLLLSLGASPYSKDISGNTALHWAFTSNNNGAVRLFNYEGLDFTICNEEGVSPWSPGDCQPQWMEHKLWRRIVDEHNSEKLFGRFKNVAGFSNDLTKTGHEFTKNVK
ncbi:hypothetical protein QYM36_010078 [Artemia franciscana]|uniref:Uncharacterized protein n=1 Tax=Artemia franciscana TaxID=6661 RepID=A0AA88HW83_ARTSF|nr:hypothetical protein QYM36_010078 [Artemia franciscana]